jgi:2-phospho-L-lactate guanylyltransferase
MSIWAIVPVKPFREGKSRLASVLSQDERAELSRSFLNHTLDVLQQTHLVGRTLVISRDTAALHLARTRGAFTVTESGAPELNAALARATDVAVSLGAKALLIIPSDLPLVSAEDIVALIHSNPALPGVSLAPDRHGTGTNALFLRPARAIPYVFGADSFARHMALARHNEVPVAICRLPGLSLDVDLPDDLELYKSSSRIA